MTANGRGVGKVGDEVDVPGGDQPAEPRPDRRVALRRYARQEILSNWYIRSSEGGTCSGPSLRSCSASCTNA